MFNGEIPLHSGLSGCNGQLFHLSALTNFDSSWVVCHQVLLPKSPLIVCFLNHSIHIALKFIYQNHILIKKHQNPKKQ